MKSQSPKGLIHLGVLILVIFTLTIAASVGILAQPNNPQRSFSVETISKTLCDKSENSIWCIYKKPIIQPSNDVATSTRGPCYPAGDVNSDSVINDKDAQAILNYISRIGQATNPDLNIWDVDTDSQISSKDAVTIRDYLQGKISTFSICHSQTSPTTNTR